MGPGRVRIRPDPTKAGNSLQRVILEIRTYRLHRGTRDEFVRCMWEESLPLLNEYGIEVVACGQSLVDENGAEEAFLIRAFTDLDERERQEEAFYGSEEWHSGPRDHILSLIESYHTIIMETTEQAVDELRQDNHR